MSIISHIVLAILVTSLSSIGVAVFGGDPSTTFLLGFGYVVGAVVQFFIIKNKLGPNYRSRI